MTATSRVVFDCNIFLQALAAPDGPSGRCVQLAFDGTGRSVRLAIVLQEIREVANRPKVAAKLKLEAKRVDEFIAAIEVASTLMQGFPETFTYERDPDDAHYVNLALAADAKLIVTRDNDLLDLMREDTSAARDFQARFPMLRILTPVGFLRELGI